MNKWVARGLSIIAAPMIFAMLMLAVVLEIMMRMVARDGDRLAPLAQDVSECIDAISDFYARIWGLE